MEDAKRLAGSHRGVLHIPWPSKKSDSKARMALKKGDTRADRIRIKRLSSGSPACALSKEEREEEFDESGVLIFGAHELWIGQVSAPNTMVAQLVSPVGELKELGRLRRRKERGRIKN